MALVDGLSHREADGSIQHRYAASARRAVAVVPIAMAAGGRLSDGAPGDAGWGQSVSGLGKTLAKPRTNRIRPSSTKGYIIHPAAVDAFQRLL